MNTSRSGFREEKDICAIQFADESRRVESDELVKRSRAVIDKSLGDYFYF